MRHFEVLGQQGGHSLAGRAVLSYEEIGAAFKSRIWAPGSDVRVIWKGALHKRHAKYLLNEQLWYEYLFAGAGTTKSVDRLVRHVAPYLGRIEYNGRSGLCFADVGTPMNRYLARLQTHFVSGEQRALRVYRDPATGAAYSAAAVDLASRTWESVLFLHLQGMVHGDLKPSNVVVADEGGDHDTGSIPHSHNGEVRLVDFGRSFRGRSTLRHPLLKDHSEQVQLPPALQQSTHRPATGMYEPAWWSDQEMAEYCSQHELYGEATDVFGAALLSMDWLIGLSMESLPHEARPAMKAKYHSTKQYRSMSVAQFLLHWARAQSAEDDSDQDDDKLHPTVRRRRQRLAALLAFAPGKKCDIEDHPLFSLWADMTHSEPDRRPSMYAAMSRWARWKAGLVLDQA